MLTAFLFPLGIMAQSDYTPGYIVKNNGDTVRGLLLLRSPKKNCQKCVFRLNEKQKKQTFSAQDIQSYRFDNSLYYVSHEIKLDGKPTKVFLEWGVKGRLDLYFYYSKGNPNRYFVDKSDSGFCELLNTKQETVNAAGASDIHEQKEFAGTLAVMLKDCPSLVPEIYKSTLETKNLIRLSTDYQNRVCPDEKCIVFKRPDRKMSVELGPVVGLNFPKLYWPPRDQLWDEIARAMIKYTPSPALTFGVSARFSNMDFLSARTFLQADLVYMHTKYGNNTYGTTYSFDQLRLSPLIGYAITLNRIKPSVAFGPVLHYRVNVKTYDKVVNIPGYGIDDIGFPGFTLKTQFGVCGQLGAAYKLSNRVNISLNAHFERGGKFIGFPDDKTYTSDIYMEMGLNYRLGANH